MLADFIEVNSLKAEIISCKKPVVTARDAMTALNISLEDIGKTILFILDSEKPVLAILSGSDKASMQKLCALLNARKCRIASANEVLEITGYEVGGVPPISVYGVQTVIDSKLVEKKQVICGGGDAMHLLRISPKEVLDFAFECKTADIRE